MKMKRNRLTIYKGYPIKYFPFGAYHYEGQIYPYVIQDPFKGNDLTYTLTLKEAKDFIDKKEKK